jgi:DNA-binding MarR family transcriptional regulator
LVRELLPLLIRRVQLWRGGEDLVRALVARGHDKGNVSTSLQGLETKGLVTITRTPGGRAEAVDLTPEGRHRVAALTASCE